MTGLTSPTHIVIILVLALLLFGAKRLPEMGRSLGHGMREFKESVTGHEESSPALPETTSTASTSTAREHEKV